MNIFLTVNVVAEVETVREERAAEAIY